MQRISSLFLQMRDVDHAGAHAGHLLLLHLDLATWWLWSSCLGLVMLLPCGQCPSPTCSMLSSFK